ncbi:MAG: ABC transporter ATP-binding protein [Planctomycetota bacterium]
MQSNRTGTGDGVAAIEARGLGRAFRVGLGRRRQHVLESVDIAIAPGDTLGLVGANGSGKTTLLRLLAGVDRPTSGSALVHGVPPTDRSVRQRLAFLPDGSPFPDELSAPAVLDLVGALAGLRRAERRARAAGLLDEVGLAAAGRAPLRTFSRGMLRRFGLAQVSLADPDVVLLDEPTAGLDAPGFDVLARMLGRMRERGATIVLASHVASDLIEHCDVLALLDRGRVARHGTPDELLGAPDQLELRVQGVALDGAGGVPGDVLDAISRSGGTLVQAGPARRPLVDLYRDVGSAARK